MTLNFGNITLDPDIFADDKLPVMAYVGTKRILATFPVADGGASVSSLHYALETEGGRFVAVSFKHSPPGLFEIDDPYADEWDNGTEAILAAYMRAGWQPAVLHRAIEARGRRTATDDITTGPGERGTC